MKPSPDIKRLHDLLVESGLFRVNACQAKIEDIESSPHHLDCIDSKVVLYLDNKYPEYYKKREVTLTIMDWTKKYRPKISFEEFCCLTTDEVRNKILFYIDLFV